MEALSLNGIRVVEYSTGVAGAYCAKLMADAGAEVLKIEPPEGDPLRHRRYSLEEKKAEAPEGLFQFLNTNKLGVTLNLRKREGRRLLDRFLPAVDVLLWDGPALLARELRLHYRNVRRVNPRVVVVSLTPFGLTGPYRDFKANEFVTYNLGGLAHVTPGPPDFVENMVKEPPLHPRAPVADIITGMMGAAATLLALLSRRRGGSGSQVDIAAMEVIASMTTNEVSTYSYGGIVRGRMMNNLALMPNAMLPCKDGWLAVACPHEHHWQRLVVFMGSPDWASWELFETREKRAIYWDALKPLLEEWTMGYTGDEIVHMTQERGIPCFRAYSVGEMAESEQMRAREFFWQVPVAGGTAQVPGPLFKLSESPSTLRRPAPALGEHNDLILSERLGIPADELRRLGTAGVV